VTVRALALAALLLAGAAQARWPELDTGKLVASARSQVGVTVAYDGSYRKLAYPGGDVPKETGVCTDVVIRALREQGIDLQKKVHEDMRANFRDYPQHWGLRKPDANIDHRRVPNLMAYFTRQGFRRLISREAADYRAGDIVAWDLGGGITHIGIISDRQSVTGTPLVLHNIGAGAKEEDILFGFRIIGSYRLAGDQ
jgi:uncharacterized protein YijF (DUF1287 family)